MQACERADICSHTPSALSLSGRGGQMSFQVRFLLYGNVWINAMWPHLQHVHCDVILTTTYRSFDSLQLLSFQSSPECTQHILWFDVFAPQIRRSRSLATPIRIGEVREKKKSDPVLWRTDGKKNAGQVRTTINTKSHSKTAHITNLIHSTWSASEIPLKHSFPSCTLSILNSLYFGMIIKYKCGAESKGKECMATISSLSFY